MLVTQRDSGLGSGKCVRACICVISDVSVTPPPSSLSPPALGDHPGSYGYRHWSPVPAVLALHPVSVCLFVHVYGTIFGDLPFCSKLFSLVDIGIDR